MLLCTRSYLGVQELKGLAITHERYQLTRTTKAPLDVMSKAGGNETIVNIHLIIKTPST